MAFAAAVLCSISGAPRADTVWDLDAGWTHDSNLTRAQNAADIRPDAAVAATVGLTQFFAPTGDDGITLGAFVRGEAWRRYPGLNNVVAGVRGGYRHKFGLGYEAPWFAVYVDGSYDDYRDALRDSTRLNVRAETGKRFSAEWDALAGVAYDRRYDKHGESLVPGIPGDVFNLRGFGGYAQTGYAFTQDFYASARLGVRRGDVESTAQPGPNIFIASSAIAADPVFNDDTLFAYRLNGTTWSLALNGSLALNDHSSINVGYVEERTYGAYGNDYRTRAVSVIVAYRQ